MQLTPGRLKNSDGSLQGDVFESWELSPDRLTLTGRLNNGARYPQIAPVNGRPVDVDDVLFSWDRFTKKSSTRAGVANVADPGAPVLSLTATDSKTIVMRLKEPLVYVLSLFCSNSSGGVIVLPKRRTRPSIFGPT